MHSSVGANTSFASQLNFESTMFSNFKRLVNPMRLTASNMSAFAQNAGNWVRPAHHQFLISPDGLAEVLRRVQDISPNDSVFASSDGSAGYMDRLVCPHNGTQSGSIPPTTSFKSVFWWKPTFASGRKIAQCHPNVQPEISYHFACQKSIGASACLSPSYQILPCSEVSHDSNFGVLAIWQMPSKSACVSVWLDSRACSSWSFNLRRVLNASVTSTPTFHSLY